MSHGWLLELSLSRLSLYDQLLAARSNHVDKRENQTSHPKFLCWMPFVTAHSILDCRPWGWLELSKKIN